MAPALQDRKTRRAVLGGSFDPIHRGHLEMAKAAREAVGLESVVFMPCFVSPFKSGTVADSDQRLAMLNLALAEMDMPWAEVSTFEIDRTGPSYSWETASHLHAESPEVDWYWIVGTDQWDSIERWAEPDQLQELLHFIVLTRDGQSVVEREGWRYTPISFSHPASSTAIREDFENRREWLTESVSAYCRETGLYQSGW